MSHPGGNRYLEMDRLLRYDALMNATAQKLADQALALPPKERALLAHKLIASLDAETDPAVRAQSPNLCLEVTNRVGCVGRLLEF